MSDQSEEPKAYNIEAISGLNKRGEGFVHLRIEFSDLPAGVVQATPAKAREIAQFINEAAEAADADAFLYQFLTREIGSDEQRALMVIAQFRKYRELSGGVKARSREDPHFNELKERMDAAKRPPPLDPTRR